jgi:ParB-like chromosome segregation protein Spo0J
VPKEISRVLVPYEDIMIGEDFNGRKLMKNLEELAASLDENGLIQPLVLREGGPSKTDGRRKYFLIAGERRYQAIGRLRDPNWSPPAGPDGKKGARKRGPAAWAQVEAKLVKGNTQENSILNLIENLQREGLEPLEEAQAMKDYMEKYSATQAQLAKKLGKSEPYVSQRLTLLKSTAPEVKEAIDKGVISATHAREMVALPPTRQKSMLKDIEELQRNGKKVSVADVKVEADRHKAELGIHPTREPRIVRNVPDYDEEKVALARRVYQGKSFDVRPKAALIEQLGALLLRLQRPQLAEASRLKIKAQVDTVEWFLGIRDTLP